MAVLRDYVLNTFDLKDSFAPVVNPESVATTVSGQNELLQGSVKRTNTSYGMTAVVSEGENIQVAIDNIRSAGGGTVLLLPGLYTLTSNLYLWSNVTLEGAARDTTIIDCNGSYGVKMNGLLYSSTGTVSVNNGATTVTGVGTSWTSSFVGKNIWLDGYYYPIASVTSGTVLELSYGYGGDNLSGVSVVIADIINNARVNKVTIRNATGIGLEADFAVEPSVGDLYISGCGTGVDMYYSTYMRIISYVLECGVNGNFEYCSSPFLDWCSFDYSTTGAGLVLSNCKDGTVSNSSISFNATDGLDVSSSEFINFMTCIYTKNAEDGAYLGVDNNRLSFLTDGHRSNGGYGINISAASNTNTKVGLISYDSNVSGTLNDLGTGTVTVP